MRSIISWSLRFRLVVLTAAAMLLFFGLTQLRNVPVDVLPEFQRLYVEIQTEALGLSAAEVEAMITVPLEADMLNGVPWADEIRSASIPGLSSIVLFFEPGTDMLTARQVVQERLIEVHALPGVSKPPVMLQPVSSANRVMAVGVRSDDKSLIELSVLSRWTIVPRLMGVPGVAQVSIWGQRKRQLQVQVDPERLRDEGVTLQQIVNTTGNSLWMSPLSYLDASTPGTGGWIETPNQRLGIQHLLPISVAEDLARVTVEGTSKPLGALTNVVENHQPLIGDALIGDSPSLMLVIERFPWANTVEVTAAVEEAISALQLGLPGVEMDTTLFRAATYLELATENLSLVLLIGVVLLAVALFLATFNWRTTLIGVVAVLISALAAVMVLNVRGIGLNMMILGGLVAALLLLIDDAVIDIQNLMRRLREDSANDQGLQSAQTILAAALQVRRPMVHATIIIALALVPVVFIDGFGGAFSQPIVLGYGLALLASFATALTVTPVLSALLLRGAASSPDSGLAPLSRLQRGYESVLARVSDARVTVFAVAAVGVLVVVGLWGGTRISGISILPTFQERDVLITMDAMPGSSEHAMRRAAARLTSALREIPGVNNASAHVGRAVMSDRVNDINSGEIWINLDRGVDYGATLHAVRSTVAEYPGFDLDVDTFLDERLRDTESLVNKLAVRVYGEDMETLRSKAEEVRALLAGVDELKDAEVMYPEEHPNLEIEVDLEAAKQYGLSPGGVRRAAATLIAGLEVGSLFEEQKVFDVVVWGTPEVRNSLNSVGDLLIDTPTGGHVRLKEVADTRIVPQPTVIKREAVARHIDVEAEVEGRSVAAVAAYVTERIRENIDFPLEYRAEVLGDPIAASASQARLRTMAIAVAIGIFLLLQAAFGSWSLAVYVLLVLPAALVGGIATSFVFGEVFSLGSLLGLLGLFGLAVRNALLLMAQYRDPEGSGEAFSRELVFRGARERFIPTLTTAVVAALVFLPMLFSRNVAGLEVLHPMAVAVFGGLISFTLVSLFVMPALYLAFGASAEPFEIGLE